MARPFLLLQANSMTASLPNVWRSSFNFGGMFKFPFDETADTQTDVWAECLRFLLVGSAWVAEDYC
jgi:hypothetical protein